MNGAEITDLDEAIPDFETAGILGSEKDYLIVCDSYSEMIGLITNMYVSFFRFYENFKRNASVVWINSDADIVVVNKFVGKNRCYLGKWDHPYWKRLKREMYDLCERRLIVRKEWVEWYGLEIAAKQDGFVNNCKKS